MIPAMQEGIYIGKGQTPGHSFSCVFLRRSNNSTAKHVGDSLTGLWSMYQYLKKGVTQDLESRIRPQNYNNFTVLIGYSRNVFSDDVKRKIPKLFRNWDFKCPEDNGGGELVEGSALRFDNSIFENHAVKDDIIIQFVGNNEFITNRAVTETWRFLHDPKNTDRNSLALTKSYTGFHGLDGRDWLGFYDGVSNLKKAERTKVVAISNNEAERDDQWTIGGSYMAFFRIKIDIKKWQKLSRFDQELIIGRDKLTGCPIIGVDKNGMPVKDSRCPVKGTFNVTEYGNAQFREHPSYGRQRNIPAGISDSVLRNSHIGSIMEIDINRPYRSLSARIYRQGYNFFEIYDKAPGFRVGLNFISFQNNPDCILRMLKYGFSNEISRIGQNRSLPSIASFLSVHSGGIFFVPPLYAKEPFPGASIFIGN